MSDHDPLKALWTKQKDEPITMSDADIRSCAEKLDATIWWRNAREHIAAAFVVLFFGYHAVMDDNPVTQAGAGLIVLAAAFVSLRLSASARALPGADPAAAWLDRYRAQLVRQHDVLRTVWRWYALPFVPGLALMTISRQVYPHMRLGELGAWLNMGWTLAFVGAVFGGVIWLNHVAAKKLQADIEELDRANRG